MKKSGVGRWLLPVLRYGLCAVAVVYLYFAVSWYDYVKLRDAAGTMARVVEERDDGLVVLQNGQTRSVTIDEVVTVPDSRAAEIHYGIRNVVLNASASRALLAILIFLPVPFMAAMRLVWMLAIQDVRLGLWHSIKLTFAGNFFNFALPGTTGGDLIKAYYITRCTEHKTEAVTTVFLDRVIGLLGLMVLSTVLLMVAWERVPWEPEYRKTLLGSLLAIWAGLAAASAVVFSQRLRSVLRLASLAERMPAGQHLLRVGRATIAMRRHKGLVLASLAITVALQLLVVASAFLMARALGMKGDAELYFICVPIGFLIAAIPIAPPQAFGVMEWAYIQFFAKGGLNPTSAAVAFALANRLIQLVWALPGVLVPLLGAHVPSTAEIEELEQDDESRPSGAGTPSGAAEPA